MTGHTSSRRGFAALAVAVTLLLAGAGCTDTTRPPAGTPVDGDAVSQSPSAEVTATPADLVAAVDRFLELPYTPYYRNLGTVLVSVDHRVWVEQSYGGDPDSRHDVSSIAGSVLSLLVGIALDDGSIEGPDATVADLLDSDRRSISPEVRGRTLQELLTSHEPGTADVLVRVLEAATGRPVAEFARSRLFEPLGIRPAAVAEEGANPLETELSAYDLLRLGHLVLDGGRVDQRQVVPEAWVTAATGLVCDDSGSARNVVRSGQADRSGEPVTSGHSPDLAPAYQWWTTRAGGHPATAAIGDNGLLLEVVPRLDLAVVVVLDGRQTQRSRPQDYLGLVGEVVAPALDPALDGR